VTLSNLSDGVMESYFGYYGDEWVKVTLKAYVG
jgi:hypothetical protein